MTYYKFGDQEFTERRTAEEYVDTYAEENIEEYLDETVDDYNPFGNEGITYSAYWILKNCDPVMLHCIVCDYANSLYEEIEEVEEDDE